MIDNMIDWACEKYEIADRFFSRKNRFWKRVRNVSATAGALAGFIQRTPYAPDWLEGWLPYLFTASLFSFVWSQLTTDEFQGRRSGKRK